MIQRESSSLANFDNLLLINKDSFLCASCSQNQNDNRLGWLSLNRYFLWILFGISSDISSKISFLALLVFETATKKILTFGSGRRPQVIGVLCSHTLYIRDIFEEDLKIRTTTWRYFNILSHKISNQGNIKLLDKN